jgi:hypothetical protein
MTPQSISRGNGRHFLFREKFDVTCKRIDDDDDVLDDETVAELLKGLD